MPHGHRSSLRPAVAGSPDLWGILMAHSLLIAGVTLHTQSSSHGHLRGGALSADLPRRGRQDPSSLPRHTADFFRLDSGPTGICRFGTFRFVVRLHGVERILLSTFLTATCISLSMSVTLCSFPGGGGGSPPQNRRVGGGFLCGGSASPISLKEATCVPGAE